METEQSHEHDRITDHDGRAGGARRRPRRGPHRADRARGQARRRRVRDRRAGRGAGRVADEAVALADGIGCPVVLKIVSPDILHKTDAGGVLVGLESDGRGARGFQTIVGNAQAYDADAGIDGVQVQQMVAAGQEVIVGAVTDPTFGKVVAFGLGGCWSRCSRTSPSGWRRVDRRRALDARRDPRRRGPARRARPRRRVDREALAAMIARVSELVDRLPGDHRGRPQPGARRTRTARSRPTRASSLEFDAADERPPRYTRGGDPRDR